MKYFSRTDLSKIYPKARTDVLDSFQYCAETLFPRYSITTVSRYLAFIAQVAHESWGFKTLVEARGDKSAEKNMVIRLK